jgi:hypothetical protein
MKQVLVPLAAVGTVAAIAVVALNTFDAPASTNLFQNNHSFISYISKHGKSYGTHEEYTFREKIYNDKMAAFAKINAKNENTFFVTSNKFTDWTDAEYKRILGYKRPVGPKNVKVLNITNPSNGVDWRDQGAVTGVKD